VYLWWYQQIMPWICLPMIVLRLVHGNCCAASGCVVSTLLHDNWSPLHLRVCYIDCRAWYLNLPIFLLVICVLIFCLCWYALARLCKSPIIANVTELVLLHGALCTSAVSYIQLPICLSVIYVRYISRARNTGKHSIFNIIWWHIAITVLLTNASHDHSHKEICQFYKFSFSHKQ